MHEHEFGQMKGVIINKFIVSDAGSTVQISIKVELSLLQVCHLFLTFGVKLNDFRLIPFDYPISVHNASAKLHVKNVKLHIDHIFLK